MPRAVGCALSVFGLAIFFNAVSLTTGLFMAVSRGAVGTDIVSFGTSVLANISATDIANLLLKTLLGGFLTGIICCRAGLSGGGKITDIPRAGTSGVVSSLAALIVLSALISIATYA
jgi:phospholipid/cholesterol/gamma-HCH transport system permease protein